MKLRAENRAQPVLSSSQAHVSLVWTIFSVASLRQPSPIFSRRSSRRRRRPWPIFARRRFHFEELPVHIPSVPGRRERGQGKVVYLRDSIGRLWPVLYPNIFAVKALTGNWTKFCEQNNIKPGDKCRFQVEDDTLCIYRVDVSHRSGEFPDK